MRNCYVRLLALLPYVFLVLSSPDVPVSTQAIVSTVVFQSTQYSVATLATTSLTTQTLDDLETVTTVVSGTTATVTTNLGATATTIKTIDSTVTTTVDQVSPITFLSTIGSTTIYGADPSSTAGNSTAAGASSTSDSSSAAGSSSTERATSSTRTDAETASSLPGSAASSLATASTSPPGSKPSNTAGSSSSSSSGGGLSAGAKAAIGTGTVIACGLLVLAAFWLGHIWQTRRNQHEELDDEYLVNPDATPYGYDGGSASPLPGAAAHDQAVRDLRGMEMRTVSDVPRSLDRNGKRRISQIPELDAEPVYPGAGANGSPLGYSSPAAARSTRVNMVAEMPGSTRYGRDGMLLR